MGLAEESQPALRAVSLSIEAHASCIAHRLFLRQLFRTFVSQICIGDMLSPASLRGEDEMSLFLKGAMRGGGNLAALFRVDPPENIVRLTYHCL